MAARKKAGGNEKVKGRKMTQLRAPPSNYISLLISSNKYPIYTKRWGSCCIATDHLCGGPEAKKLRIMTNDNTCDKELGFEYAGRH